LIGPCSKRKAVRPYIRLQGRRLKPGTLKHVARDWRSRVGKSQFKIAASQMYGGRGMSELRTVSQGIHCELFLVSAGLGWVAAEQKIPSYGLTVSNGDADEIASKIRDFSATKWWREVNKGPFAAKGGLLGIIRRLHPSRIVLALPVGYFNLVRSELDRLPSNILRRVRILGPRSQDDLPHRYQHYLLPYDQRLNGPNSPIRGTESDFAQRAAVHYLTQVARKAPQASASKDAQSVRAVMRDWRLRRRVVRVRLSDKALRAVMESKWTKLKAGKTAGIRYLRQELRIACEQARFGRIYRGIARRRS